MLAFSQFSIPEKKGEPCIAFMSLLTNGWASVPIDDKNGVVRTAFDSFEEFLSHNPSPDIDLGSGSDTANGFHENVPGSHGNRHRRGIICSNKGTVQGVETLGLLDIAYGVAKDALNAIESELKLDKNYFESTMGDLKSHIQYTLKAYNASENNPPKPLKDAGGRLLLLPSHTDPSLISVVIHDHPTREDGAGLESLSSKKSWVPVGPTGTTHAIIFAGGVLDALTGGLYPACRHRVTCDPDEVHNRRVVATFFFRPSPSAEMKVPPSLLLRDVKKPKSATFGAWVSRVARNYERRGEREKAKGVGKDVQDRNLKAKLRREALERVKRERDGTGKQGELTVSTRGEIHVEPCGTTMQMLPGEVVGREKYLGGNLGVDGKIYAIPGMAPRVLRIDPKTDTVELVGPEFKGQFKWLRGVSAKDGQGREVIYGLPCHASSVLKIVPDTGEVTTIGDIGKGLWKYHGGAYANGYVFAIPQKAERVLRINCATDEVDMIGPEYKGECKWYGGLVGPADGCIYGVPQCAGTVLRIDPLSMNVSTFGDFKERGGWQWHGGVIGPDGAIYSVPAHADSVLRIDTATQTATTFGEGEFKTGRHRSDGKYKYLGAVVGNDNMIYGFPSDSDHVLQIDPFKQTCREIGPSLEGEQLVQNKWQNGFVAPDGSIYGIPLKAKTVICIRPHVVVNGEPEVSTLGGPFEGLNKWEGGVMASNGSMYCMPLNHKSVLRVSPTDWRVKTGAVLRSSNHRAGFSRARKVQRPPTVVKPLSTNLLSNDRVSFDTEKYKLRDSVAKMIREAGDRELCANNNGEFDDLEDLQISISALQVQRKAWQQNAAQDKLTELVASGAGGFLSEWEKLVRDVVIPYLKLRVDSDRGDEGERMWWVQYPPTLRIQPGGTGKTVREHSDAMYGHQEGELNFWMPLTNYEKTGTSLWCEEIAETGDFKEIQVTHGQIGVFHGTLKRHYVPANQSDKTRVSIDFRIGIQDSFDPLWSMSGTKEDHKRLEIKY